MNANAHDPRAAPPDDAFEAERLDNLHPRNWRNPDPAGEYALLVIGGGPAGLAAAREACALGFKVALVESRLLGGTNLNDGGVPSIAVIRSARVIAQMRNADRYGDCPPDPVPVDFPSIMRRMRKLRAHLSYRDSVRQLSDLGVDVFFGQARFTGARQAEVDGRTLRFRKALIATGARPSVPDIPGLAETGYDTYRSIFELERLPSKLLVIGGGPNGCELAQAFCRFGARTTIVQDKPLFLPGEERDAAQILSDAFARDGIEVRLNTTALAARRLPDGRKQVDLVSADYRSQVEVDAIFTGIGHLPNVENLGLDVAGVDHASGHDGGVGVDDFLATSNPDIYAAGDVCLPHKYEHAAVASARLATRNALLAGRQRSSALVVPWCTFTDPQIAHVGLYVREANRMNIPVKTFTVPMHQVPRSCMDGEPEGFVKIHVREGSDRILGATIVAHDAGDMLNEITLAMVSGIGLRRLSRVIHTYPTQSEAIRRAADAYNLTRYTPQLKARLERWQSRH
jgi:pyruvate/2-oxoglutarate dehydrogenase complex dihydrolipoamide dehydrogenase (E3) component